MSQVKNLLELGKKQGYLTKLQISEQLPEEISDMEQKNDIFQIISDMGIEVRNHEAEIFQINARTKIN